MSRSENRQELLTALRTALDLWGADARRWPDAGRARLTAFVARDAEAARLVAEARALDAVLGHAPAGAPAAGLEARILAAAALTPQMPRPTVVAMAEARNPRLAAAPRAVPPHRRRTWQAVALLAASLILGVALGMAGQSLPVLRDIDALAMAGGDGDALGFGETMFDPGAFQEQEQL